ncbi:MAG: glycosyltransferase family 4 protein [Elusimicrobia bacterium]|nr:glycosyltransferase family 4 protein [Elusimicrobiota bacterium]
MPFKIIHVITKLELGGAQANTLYTAAHLDKKLFSVSLVCGPGGDLSAETGGTDTISVLSLRREINPFRDCAALFSLYRLLKKEKPDLVHTHSSKAGILARAAARLAGVPAIIHTFHGFGFNDRQIFLKRRLYIFLEKLCARFTDALIFVSSANMETARALGIGSPKTYRLIRSGIKLSNYPAPGGREKKRAEMGLAPGELAVISLGNTKPQKNPRGFISIAQKVTHEVKNSKFIFAGGGRELDYFRGLAESLGLKDKCIFTGWRTDTAELLAAADMFLLASLWEGLPRSLVEALASGLPAVCYKTDGVADLIKEAVNGFSAMPGEEAELAAAAERVLKDAGLRIKLAEGARATDLSAFDIDLMVKQQEELYLELLKKNLELRK